MAKSWKIGGVTPTGSVSIALPGQKLATSKNPRMLTRSEIDLLRQDLATALTVVGQDEIDDIESVLREQGFDATEFEIWQEEEPVTSRPGAATIRVVHKGSDATASYRTERGTAWLVNLARDLKSGVFGPALEFNKTAETQFDATSVICKAIQRRLCLEFHYHDRLRVVEPYCIGVSTRGTEVLRAVQVRGLSSSGGYKFGKLWVVADMVNPRILDETFVPDDPNYNPDDSAMKEIYCRI
jgi:hypothetical protein